MTEATPSTPTVTALRCTNCGHIDAPPRDLCSSCYGSVLERVPVEGAGTLVTWTVIRRPPERFRRTGPYCVAVVDLDAGIRVTGRMATVPEALELGTRVSLLDMCDGIAIFQPTSAGDGETPRGQP